MSQIVKIKENANKARYNLGLENEGRSKFPGCVDMIQPTRGRDGRWRTGLDEFAPSILAIPNTEERLAAQERIKKTREELQSLTGKDLSPLSPYWDTYLIEVSPTIHLDLTNANDRIRYHVLMASDAVAPSLKAATTDADYLYAKYYIAKEYEEVADQLSQKKKYNDAVIAMSEMLKTPDKAVMIGRYLELNVNPMTPPDNMYLIFQTYLDDDARLGSIDKFMSAVRMDYEELNTKIIITDSVRHNVIRQRDGLFQRGNITLGKNMAEVLHFLLDPKNSSELLSIQEEIDMKKKFG
jgi:hypothetical protein